MKRIMPIAPGVALISAMFVTACQESAPTANGSVMASRAVADQRRDNAKFTDRFELEKCAFTAEGHTTYFSIEPGYQLVLEGNDEGVPIVLQITVLHETRQVGNVMTRVVEERETKSGQLAEISRNYYAICKENGSIFYFGEDVDFYKNGEIVGHEGSWLHGKDGARAGLIMPALVLLGSRYHQEIAPGVALDRSEVLRLDAVATTPAGRFIEVLMTEETTPLDPSARDHKFYAPTVGLVNEGVLSLVRFGFE